jgi:hypothetical protein
MHILSALFFSMALMLAFSVIGTMLISHIDRISAALCGVAFFPGRALPLLNVRGVGRTKQAANDAGYRFVRMRALDRLPLAA